MDLVHSQILKQKKATLTKTEENDTRNAFSPSTLEPSDFVKTTRVKFLINFKNLILYLNNLVFFKLLSLKWHCSFDSAIRIKSVIVILLYFFY